MARTRVDVLMHEKGLVRSRSQARDLVRRGLVRVNGEVASKPAMTAPPDAQIVVDDPHVSDVSRGANKLRAALDAFGFDAAGRVALDVGSSTGGFSQVLLDAGAAHVYAVDTGRDQLVKALKANQRVTSMEGVDARTLQRSDFDQPLTAVVADVSFISLRLVLPPVLSLIQDRAWLIALIKPQFEVGPDHVGKGGVVRDPAQHDAAVDRVRNLIASTGCWATSDVIPSPIAGGSGNKEFLIGATYNEQ